MAEEKRQDDAGSENVRWIDPAQVDVLTYKVIGIAQKVHAALGPGFGEAVYQRAMTHELMRQGVSFQSQPEYEVYYEGLNCGTYKPDIVVEGWLIVELKAAVALVKEHTAQVVSYLKASSLPVVLLLNFGAPSLQVRRFDLAKLRLPACGPAQKSHPHNPVSPHNPFPPAPTMNRSS